VYVSYGKSKVEARKRDRLNGLKTGGSMAPSESNNDASKSNENIWQVELGMHLFRQAERETLRVLKPIKGNGISVDRKVFVAKCEQHKRVARSSRIESLPFASPVRASARRRVRKKKQTRSVGPREGYQKIKNPVKVRTAQPGNFVKVFVDSNGIPCQANGHACISECHRRRFPNKTGTALILEAVGDGWICNSWRSDLIRELGKKKGWKRSGKTRRERRQSWFKHSVLSRIPKKVISKLSGTVRSKIISKWMHNPTKLTPFFLRRDLTTGASVLRKSPKFVGYVPSKLVEQHRHVGATALTGRYKLIYGRRAVALGTPHGIGKLKRYSSLGKPSAPNFF